MDGKTRCSVQYVINLLVLDAIPLFNAVDLAMDRIRGVRFESLIPTRKSESVHATQTVLVLWNRTTLSEWRECMEDM